MSYYQKKYRKPYCPEHKIPMVFRENGLFKDSQGRPKPFYVCPNFPRCRENHGAHMSGVPLGKPVSAEVRELRKLAHNLAAMIWGELGSPGSDLKGMYRWLKINTKSGHIGKMEKDEVLSLIEALRRKIRSGKLWSKSMV